MSEVSEAGKSRLRIGHLKVINRDLQGERKSQPGQRTQLFVTFVMCGMGGL